MWIIYRIGAALVTIALAVTLTFVMLRVLPGDPLSAQAMEAGLTQQEFALQRQLSGIDDSLLSQYSAYWLSVIAGEWGRSLYTGLTVRDMIFQQLHHTIWLATNSMVLAIVLGFGLGYAATLRRLYGALAQFMIDLTLAMPIYWTGTLVVFILATMVDGLRGQIWLPVLVLGFHSSGAIAQVVQTQISDVKHQPYIQTAHAKGLSQSRIALIHIFRPVLLTVLPLIVLQFGFLLSGTVITEIIFQRSGIGSVLLRATLQQDYPVVQGIVLLSAVAFVILTLIADIVSQMIDPRLRFTVDNSL